MLPMFHGQNRMYGAVPNVTTGTASVNRLTLTPTVTFYVAVGYDIGVPTATEIGIYCSTSSIPGISNTIPVSFISTVGGFHYYKAENLNFSETYYYRGFATNENGTAVGDVISFTTHTNKVYVTLEYDTNLANPERFIITVLQTYYPGTSYINGIPIAISTNPDPWNNNDQLHPAKGFTVTEQADLPIELYFNLPGGGPDTWLWGDYEPYNLISGTTYYAQILADVGAGGLGDRDGFSNIETFVAR